MNEEKDEALGLNHINQGGPPKKKGSRELSQSIAFYQETSPSLFDAINELEQNLDCMDDPGSPIEETREGASFWDSDLSVLTESNLTGASGLGDLQKELEIASLRAESDKDSVKKVNQGASRPGMNRGFSFIKRQSVRNLVKGIDTDMTDMEDIAEEPSRTQPSQMWESGLTYEESDDGLSLLKSELQKASMPEKPIKDNTNEVTSAYSSQNKMSSHKIESNQNSSMPENGSGSLSIEPDSEMDPNSDSNLDHLERELNDARILQADLEARESEPKFQDSSNDASGSRRPKRGLSFIRRNSLVNSLRTLGDNIDDIMEDMSQEVSLKLSQLEIEDLEPNSNTDDLERELENASCSIHTSVIPDSTSLEFKMDSYDDVGKIPNKLDESSRTAKFNRINNATTAAPEHKSQLENTSAATNSIDASFNEFRGLQKKLTQSKCDSKKVSRGVAMELPQHQPKQASFLQKRNMELNNEIKAEQNRFKELQEELNQMKDFSLNETDIYFKKFLYESYGKRSWILWLFGGIFLTILLSSRNPEITPIPTSSKTTSKTLGSVKVIPSKAAISEHKYLKQALIEAKLINAETEEMKKNLKEDELVMDNLIKILHSQM